MRKCDFNTVTKQLYSNHASAWVYSVIYCIFPEHLLSYCIVYITLFFDSDNDPAI